MDFIPDFIGKNVVQKEAIYLPAGHGKISAALRSEMAEAAAGFNRTFCLAENQFR